MADGQSEPDGFARLRAAMAVTDCSGPEKAVLLVLTIRANRQGKAWPSFTTIAADASLGRRTVIRALDQLESRGLIERASIAGKGATYTLRLPCQSGTSVAAAPVPEGHSTSARAAPKQPRNSHEKKASPPSLSHDAFPKPDGVDDQHWADLLENRKRKRCPNTASAHARLIRDLNTHATAEWPVARLVQLAAESGWAGIYPPKDQSNGRQLEARRSGADAVRGNRPDPAVDMFRAAVARPDDGSEGDPYDYRRDRNSLPAYLRH